MKIEILLASDSRTDVFEIIPRMLTMHLQGRISYATDVCLIFEKKYFEEVFHKINT